MRTRSFRTYQTSRQASIDSRLIRFRRCSGVRRPAPGDGSTIKASHDVIGHGFRGSVFGCVISGRLFGSWLISSAQNSSRGSSLWYRTSVRSPYVVHGCNNLRVQARGARKGNWHYVPLDSYSHNQQSCQPSKKGWSNCSPWSQSFDLKVRPRSPAPTTARYQMAREPG